MLESRKEQFYQKGRVYKQRIFKNRSRPDQEYIVIAAGYKEELKKKQKTAFPLL